MAKLTPLVIKSTNFLLYSASGCIIPYLSVYFLHYTEATSSDVGVVMLFASFFGIISSLTFCSVGDRYRAHRLVFIVSLCLTCLSFTILFGPIAVEVRNGNLGNNSSSSSTDVAPLTETIPTDLDVSTIDEDDNDEPPYSTRILYRSTSSIENELLKFPPAVLLVDKTKDKFWFYMVAICLGFGTMTLTVNINMCDSFSTEIASKCHTSYGAVRLWGSIGLLFSSSVLIFLNKIDWAPFLAPSLCLFTCLTLVNILLVTLWPDNRAFDLGGTRPSPASTPETSANPLHFQLEQLKQQAQVIDKTKPNEMRASQLRFKFSRSGHFLRKLSSSTKRNCSLDLGLQDITRQKSSGGGVAVLSKARQSFAFDLAAEDVCRNVRRCSLAPLGDSHLLKQFELAPATNDNQVKNCKTLAHKLTSDASSTINGNATQKHFNFVTVIEPLDSGNGLTEQTKEFNLMLGKSQTSDEKLKNYFFTGLAEANKSNGAGGKLGATAESNEPMSLRLHMKIIQLIAERDEKMLRFMVLFSVIGLTSSMNLVYLFPYLNELNSAKFKQLSAFVMVSTFLSETIFYKYSASFTRFLDNSTSLSVVLFVYAARYSMYLLISVWPHVWPIETIVAIELLQSFSMGLFNCVFTDASFRFALEARECVPKLIELKLIDGSRESIERVNNGVKLTLLSVSSCCYDGVGIALGSLLGGWLIDNLGFHTLWLTSIVIALTFGLLNLVTLRRDQPGEVELN